MLRLPAFIERDDMMPDAAEIADGFALTGFFLMRHAFEPRGLGLPDARAQFIAALARPRRAAAG
jgi:DNA repair protein RecO (recombination protein O)